MTETDRDPINTPMVSYVQTSSYLLMRLRMLLTGTNGPDDEVWTKALRDLLAHLAENPVPGIPEDRVAQFASVWGTNPSPQDEKAPEMGTANGRQRGWANCHEG